jgi:hypothetical protein
MTERQIIIYLMTLKCAIIEMKEISILRNGVTNYLASDVNSKILE